ncbi:MAG: phage terminase large subunit family protein [Patescibacteria group bacterium]|nr:phage terminase large subunit family protein [Patescibacteria group bacterium]
MLEQLDRILWAEKRIEQIDNRVYSLDAFPHLRAIADDNSRVKIIEKAAQQAITMDCVIEESHKVWAGLNWIHAFPTDKMLSRFVKPRFDKLFTQNSKLAELVRNINNVTVKEIGKGVIYFLGLGSATKEGGEFDVLSIAADGVTLDERTRIKPNRVKDILSRMNASPHKFQRRISTPKLPFDGIDEDYQETDKKVLGIKCEGCNEWNFLDDDEHYHRKDYAEWAMSRIQYGFLTCEKCGKALNVFNSEFVKQITDKVEWSGYHVSALYSPFADYNQMLRDFQGLSSSRETQTYWNDIFGFPYVDVKAKLSKELILQRCTGKAMDALGKDTFLGLDIGGSRKGLHCVIGKPDSNWDYDIVWLGVIHEPNPEDPKFMEWLVNDIAQKMNAFGVRKGCIDGEPQHISRAIANSIRKIWRVQYNDSQRDGFKWDDEKRMVSVNRTESLDNSHEILSKKKFNLRRRNEEIEQFAEHCAALVKDEEVDEDTGQKTYTWKKIAKYDDYRHAFNYMVLASGYDGRTRTIKPVLTTFIPPNVREILEA